MRTAALITSALVALTLSAAVPSDSLISARMGAVTESRDGMWRIAGPVFDNPALNQWRLAGSVTSVFAGFDMRDDGNGWVEPRQGKGTRFGNGGAGTYTKYKSTTLWGSAKYTNGRRRDVRWCETSDRELLYPYLLADSVGGDMRSETYSFAGGYADHRGRWAWGGTLSYLATLEYRSVDPRPRNIAGTLDASLGVAYRVAGDYYAGISASFRKYKQSNDIEFKSEMGVDKIFHLTGMGNHYKRFDGTGLNTHYDGHRYGLSADIYPSSGQGAFASVRISRFTFDNILTDLNKLPLSSLWHNELTAIIGYKGTYGYRSGGIAADFATYRRHGSENIFGDGSGQVYPLIGSIEMHAVNSVRTGVNLRGQLGRNSTDRIYASLAAHYDRHVSAYVEPRSYRLVKDVEASLEVGGDIRSGAWLWGAVMRGRLVSPFGCEFIYRQPGTDPEMHQLDLIELHSYDLASHSHGNAGLTLRADRAIAGAYLLGFSADYDRDFYTRGIRADRLSFSLSFNF